MKENFQNNVVTSFPDILKIDFKAIEKSYLNVILIHLSFIFIGVFGVFFFIILQNKTDLGSYSFCMYLGLFILFLFSAIVKKISFKRRKYAVRQKDISYKDGLFFKTMTTVPFNRIQHIEIDQGPVSRFFNLVSLSVFTAGDSSDDLKVSGLLKEHAEQIKEYISTQIDG